MVKFLRADKSLGALTLLDSAESLMQCPDDVLVTLGIIGNGEALEAEIDALCEIYGEDYLISALV